MKKQVLAVLKVLAAFVLISAIGIVALSIIGASVGALVTEINTP